MNPSEKIKEIEKENYKETIEILHRDIEELKNTNRGLIADCTKLEMELEELKQQIQKSGEK